MIYVLTKSIENSMGKYFIYAWDHKPNIDEMMIKIEEEAWSWENEDYPSYKKGTFFQDWNIDKWKEGLLQVLHGEEFDYYGNIYKLKQL